jgi:hypothetical protein
VAEQEIGKAAPVVEQEIGETAPVLGRAWAPVVEH